MKQIQAENTYHELTLKMKSNKLTSEEHLKLVEAIKVIVRIRQHKMKKK